MATSDELLARVWASRFQYDDDGADDPFMVPADLMNEIGKYVAQMAKKSYTDKKRDDSSRIEILLRNSATK